MSEEKATASTGESSTTTQTPSQPPTEPNTEPRLANQEDFQRAVDAAVKEKIEKVRRDEQSKHRTRLEQADQLEQERQKLQEELLAEKKKREELEAQAQSATSKSKKSEMDPAQLQKIVQDSVNQAIEAREKQFREELGQRDLQIQNLSTQLTQREMEDYKRQRIEQVRRAHEQDRENVPDLIDAMVTGTTQAEIEQSILNAQAAWKDTVGRFVQTAPPSVSMPAPPAPSMGVPPRVAPSSDLESARVAFENRISNMSAKEYAEKRTEILAEQKRLFPNGPYG